VLLLRLLRRQREALRGQEQPPPKQVRQRHAAQDRPHRHPAGERLKGRRRRRRLLLRIFFNESFFDVVFLERQPSDKKKHFNSFLAFLYLS